MLKRYLAKRENPWELLAIGALSLLPGVVLLIHRGPALFVNARWSASRLTVISEGAAHVLGAFGIFVGLVFVVLYFYVRYSSARYREEVAAVGRSHPGELPLAYGSTRSPVPVLERLKFWRNRSL